MKPSWLKSFASRLVKVKLNKEHLPVTSFAIAAHLAFARELAPLEAIAFFLEWRRMTAE
jgi:hypothetical protein